MTKLQELDESTRQAAEEVRAHLVTLRGRALFLSPLDGRLLLEWLEAGVTVPFILKTLEEAAERRRAKRLKSPLKLSSIKGKVARVMGSPLASALPIGNLGALVERLGTSTDELERAAAAPRMARAPARRGAARGPPAPLMALDPAGGGEALLREALQISRDFFEAAWERADKASLREEAGILLYAFQDTMSERRFEVIREETARDLLRQRHPLLSAGHIWDTLT